jgi:putative ABC transport system permease protein
MKLWLWIAYAARNLRSGLKGFWILLTCLTLGVAALAVIGSLSRSIERGLAEQGQPLLGGDVEFSLVHREATAEEQAFIASKGATSRIATLRAMATAKDRSTLVEIKAVDQAYPLYGTLKLEGGASAPGILGSAAMPSALADPLLLGRLGLAVGDQLKIGQIEMRLAGTIVNEPDRISDGIVLGPRLLISHDTLQATGLIQPGSLVTWRYRVRLPGEVSLADAKSIVEEANTAFPDSGWRVRARDNAASGAERFVDRLGYFMTLVAIAALVIGGAGMANAVSAFVSSRRASIATLKCLGLNARDIYGLYLAEIMLVSLIGITLAMALGAAAPGAMKLLAGHILPLPVATGINWQPLLQAALLGLLVLLGFALLPLARIASIRGSDLLRNQISLPAGVFAKGWFAAAIGFLVLAALAANWFSANPGLTMQFLAGLALSFAVLAALAFVLLRIVARLPRPGDILIRHAMSELHRPGTAAFSVILSLGLGLSLFVMLALTDGTISRELRAGIPEKAPAFFVLDVRNEELPAFRAALLKERGVAAVSNAPMMRGRVVAVKGIPADQVNPKPDTAWALRGDRGLTYAETLPEGSELVAGQWWPENYAGPPLVSMVDEIADGIGLAIGDTIKVNVLGREIEAELANLRRVNWRSLGINFVMVFSPNTLKAAPHSHVVTIEMEGGDEAGLLNRMARQFPSVTAVRVKDALDTVSALLGQMLTAVRGANGLTLLTGVLVLAGALAAGLSARSYEAVVLKTYGATRRQLLAAFVIEYGLLGLVSAAFGLITGSLGAWYLARFILEMPFVFSVGTALLTALLAMSVTIVAGLIVTWAALKARPSFYLRNE